ncbi:MAG: flavodoxin-dependent (E)-4-hydroxy-3-methylbut-2-enyl-diphosphate synthase [Nanoarchaeota archaeon]
MIQRKKTKEVKIGNLKIGGNNPIRVQSMCNTKTSDVDSTVKQILELESVGCEIIRIAVPDIESAKQINKIKKQINIPLVTDIHYDYALALECIKQGIDKIRINPGNISEDKLKIIIKEAKNKKIPIRIGINIGSLPKKIMEKFGSSPKAIVESALETIKICEDLNFHNIIVSLKSSDIFETIGANKLFSEKSNYPLHLGITESGTEKGGIIKSSIGIGALLLEGIGDTIRVSLSADPKKEIFAGYSILKSLKLRKGAILISCPTCARAKIDVIKIAKEVEEKLTKIDKPIKVGILGCFVNADEAKMADIGIAGRENGGILFKNGKVIRNVGKENLVEELLNELEKLE